MKVRLPNGQEIDNVPEGTTQSQLIEILKANGHDVAAMLQPATPAEQLPKVPGASAAKGGKFDAALMALRDPLDAMAQRGIRMATGHPLIRALLPADAVEQVDAPIRDRNAVYEDSRRLAGREGFDTTRFVGNVLHPVNAVGGAYMRGANGLLMSIAGRSAVVGGGAANLQPVTDTENFGTNVAGQTVAGTVGGAVLGPVASKAATTVARLAQRARERLMAPTDAAILTRTEEVLRQWAADNGTDLSQIPQSILANVQRQVADSLRAGRMPTDPGAFVRRAEFDSLGINPLQGQVSRDPTQFARERNLRGVEGAGEPIAQRLNQQQGQLAGVLDRRGADAALEPDVAGDMIARSLRATDEAAGNRVTGLYNDARALNAGEIALDGPRFVDQASRALDAEMRGAFLPAEVRGMLQDIAAGKVPMNVSTAEQLRTILATASRASKDGNVTRALGIVRDALENTPTAGQLGDEATAAFGRARTANAARMRMREDVPALQAAVDDVSPEQFVRKFVLNADTRDTNNLLRMLGNDEAAADQVRAQVAAFLRTKAFGADAAGDGTFRQDAFNKAIRDIGTNKLRAIFGYDGADELQRLGRVAAYIQSQPAGSAVNNSNTAGAVMNLLSQVSGRFGALPVVNVLRDSVRTYGNDRAARNALLGDVPTQATELPPELQSRLLRYIGGPAAVAGGIAAGSSVGQ